MKITTTKLVSILLLFATAFTNRLISQIVNGCAFLKGDFVEIGIAPNGAFGTPGDAPIGYHPRPGVNMLYNPNDNMMMARQRAIGFVADFNKDGWDNGTPNYMGDYFMPGTVQEGFAIDINGVPSKAYSHNYTINGTTGYFGPLTGTLANYNFNATEQKVEWNGQFNNVSVKQIVTLKKSKSYFTCKVVFKNNGTDTARKIYYMRTVDPDNEVITTGTYATNNTIVNQLPNATNKTLVTAVGQQYQAYLGLGTKACEAKCFYLKSGLFPNGNLESIYDQTLPNFYNYIGSGYDDVAIGLVFKVGNLAPGDSTTISYAYILNETDLDDAFIDIDEGFLYNGQIYPAGSIIEQPEGSVLPVSIINGSNYDWTWSPTTNLNTSAGTIVNATVANAPITYIVTGFSNAVGTSTSCNIKTLTITIAPTPGAPLPTVVTPVNYCNNSITVPLVATPSPNGILQWYSTPTGGNPSSTPITPTSTIVGTQLYYVSQIVDAIESNRVPIKVITNPLPTPNLGPNKSICIGANLVLNPGTYSSYKWQDGTTAPTYTINTPNTYWVQVQNAFGCKATDSFTLINLIPAPTNFLPLDTTFCKGNIFTITPKQVFIAYAWSNSSTSPTITVSQFGKYYLTATNSTSCKGVDSIELFKAPCIPFNIPNAFTPNTDGVNDTYKPLITEVVSNYSFNIYNRWGKIIYTTTQPNSGWNGLYKGIAQPMGTYIYHIQFTDSDGIKQKYKGTVLILR